MGHVGKSGTWPDPKSSKTLEGHVLHCVLLSCTNLHALIHIERRNLLTYESQVGPHYVAFAKAPKRRKLAVK